MLNLEVVAVQFPVGSHIHLEQLLGLIMPARQGGWVKRDSIGDLGLACEQFLESEEHVEDARFAGTVRAYQQGGLV